MAVFVMGRIPTLRWMVVLLLGLLSMQRCPSIVGAQEVREFVEEVGVPQNTSTNVGLPTGVVEGGEEAVPDESVRRTACRWLPGLTEKQRLWCLDNYIFLEPIASGAKIAQDQCRKQFADRRWNCPIHRPSVFSKIYTRASKETAFVHAIQSAGVTLTLARTCSRGEAPRWCGCDTTWTRHEAVNWTWGSCSDNYVKGYELGKQFLDAGEADPSTAQSKMTLWNFEAGRLAVRRLMRLQCKCHGLTGSCAHQTCWYSLPLVRVVGSQLLKKYEASTMVKVEPTKSSLVPKRMPGRTRRRPSQEDLVHLRRSPEYCFPDPATGSLGTRGRTCQGKQVGMGSCDHLCCGRGFDVQRYNQQEQCHCKFVWCCHVKCKTCTVHKENHSCN